MASMSSTVRRLAHGALEAFARSRIDLLLQIRLDSMRCVGRGVAGEFMMMNRAWVYVSVGSIVLGTAFVGCGDETNVQSVSDAGPVLTDLASGPDGVADTAKAICEGLADGESCDDGDPCTLNDECSAGGCVGGMNEPCATDNPCEVGECVSGEGCQYELLADGASCDAHCFQDASCQAGACAVDAASAVVCPSPEANQPCLAELACDPSTGNCTQEIYVPADSLCDSDSDLCTLESCDGAGECVNSGDVVSCSGESSSDPCQTWTCDKKDGICDPVGFAGEVSCDDGNGCTSNDLCFKDEFNFIACQGTPFDVDDGNSCTDDTCVGGVITHDPIDGLPCETGDSCTPTGECLAKTCEYEGCACYEDSDCAPPEDKCLGEVFCDTSGDTPSCQLKEASAVLCAAPASPCYLAQCAPDTGECGIVPAPLGTACDDNNACTTSDGCDGFGECDPGTPLLCDNGLFCDGAEGCDPTSGCTVGVSPALTDGVACTIDSCNEDTDTLDHVGDGSFCQDENLCDGTEICDLVDGCVEGEPLACDDELYCNGSEGCEAATGCVPGVPPEFDDGVDCTQESCIESTDSIDSIPVDGLCVPDGSLCLLGVCDPAAGGCGTVTKLGCCGNGLVEAGEACDDANDAAGDGCSAGCAVEEDWTCLGSPSVCQTCGDGVVQGDEFCDAGAANGCQSCKSDCTGPVVIHFGNLTIDSAADVAAAQEISVIDGQLTIHALQDGELTLPALECVKNTLRIHNNTFQDLAGLQSLKHIGGSLHLLTNSELKHVDALSGVTTVTSLYINGNPLLANLGGLSNLTSVSDMIDVSYCGGLVTLAALGNIQTKLTGSLILHKLDSLLSLTGLEGITEVNVLKVSSNGLLSNLSGLGLIKVKSQIHVNKNGSLSSLQGLEGLSKIWNSLNITDNPLLESLDALSNITGSVGGSFTISNNTGLTGLQGLEGVEGVVGSFTLNNIPTIVTLGPLTNLATVGGIFTISSLSSLVDLSSLTSLEEVQTLTLMFNDSLTAIDLPNYGTKFVGSLEIKNNGSLASIGGFAQLEEIGGNLRIHNNESLTKLTALNGVADVGGNLYLTGNASLLNLLGLQNLEEVGNLAEISWNDNLTSLAGLSSLSEVKYLTVSNNAALNNLQGLFGLKTVSQDLQIHNNASLKQIDALSNLASLGHALTLSGNDELADVKGLSGLSFVTLSTLKVTNNSDLLDLDGLGNIVGTVDWLTVSGNDSLMHLNGLAGLVQVKTNLLIQNNDSLQDLTGLEGLVSVGHLSVDGNDKLVTLVGLHNVSVANDVTIDSNAMLVDLAGLASLQGTVGSLTLRDNPFLGSVQGLSGLNQAGNLTVDGCPSLKSLTGLEGLTLAGKSGNWLRISDNLQLANLDGLSGLSGAPQGLLYISSNLSLIHLDGLQGLQGVATSQIQILNNTSLLSIDGLKNITKANYVKVKSNALLPQCAVFDAVQGIVSPTLCVEQNKADPACPDDC